MDVRSLISDWELIRTTAPTDSLSAELTLAGSISEIAYVSRGKATWEVFVCLMAYSEQETLDPNDIVNELETYVFSRKASDAVSSFLQYGSEYATVSHEAFLSAALELRHNFADRFIVSRGSTLDNLQECRARHEPDWEKVWRCVRATGGSQSAKAKAKSEGASG